MRINAVVVGCFAAAAFLLSASVLSACPFCRAPQTTLSQRVSRADAVVLTQRLSARKKTKRQPAVTTFQVVHAAKNPDDALKRDDRIVISGYRLGRRGDLFLLLGGKRRTVVDWDDPLEVTETGYQYIVQAPPPETRVVDRLPYFFKFLEYPDDLIAGDAFNELAAASYKDFLPLADKLPRERLRKWLAEPDFTNPRIGLYGMLLGLCGDRADAQLLSRHITAETTECRLGIDGMIGGYLLLTGEQGLDVIDKRKLRDVDGPTTELFATMQALRFMWSFADGKIDNARLKRSMRIVLDRPNLADIAITDLSRWKDWGVQQQLMKLYDHQDYQAEHVKRAIVSYMIASTRDLPKNAKQLPKRVVQGRKYLSELRKKDPQIVRRAERFFLPN